MQYPEWLQVGKPKRIWFSITRHEDKPNENTPQKLAFIILTALWNHCQEMNCCFEMKKPDKLGLFGQACYEYEYKNCYFMMYQDKGWVNGKYMSVLAVTVWARFI